MINNLLPDREASLYFEAHITIGPVFDDRRTFAQEIASKYDFRVADLLMKKRSSKDTFITGHGKSLTDIQTRMGHLVHDPKDHHYEVRRYKIEDTVMDSRSEDVLDLL